MFNLVGAFLQQVGVVVGATLIAVGGFLTGSPASLPNQPQETLDSAVSTESDYHVSEQSSASVPNTKAHIQEGTQLQESPQESLQIQDVHVAVNGSGVTVTWKTTAPAESRLIFDNGEGRVFESEEGLSTVHKIRAGGLEESAEYDFKITATTADKTQYDDYFDVIYAQKSYTALLGNKSSNGCQVIIVKDTAGRIAAGKQISLKPSLNYGGVVKSTVTLTTDTNGEVKYCDGADKYRISGESLQVTLYDY